MDDFKIAIQAHAEFDLFICFITMFSYCTASAKNIKALLLAKWLCAQQETQLYPII